MATLPEPPFPASAPAPVGRPRHRSPPGLLLLWLLAAFAPRVSGMPLELVDPDHAWRATAVGKSAAPNLVIDQVFNRADGVGRIVVVSSAASAATDSLVDFAGFIKHAFARDAGADTLAIDATHLGFLGHESHFRLLRDGTAFDCELFVFADGPTRRGILCANGAGASATAYSLLARLHRPAATPAGVVGLAPLKIRDDAVSDFPISFRVIGDRAQHRVVRLLITDVADTESGRSRIQVGDEIVAIDGRPCREFDTAVGKDTELGRIFLNRSSGDEVRLDLVSAKTREPYTVTLRVNFFRTWFNR